MFSKSSYVSEFLTYKQEFNPKIVKSHNVNLINFNGHKALNGTVTYALDLHNFIANLNVIVQKRPKDKAWVLLNITLNCCEFLENINNTKITFPNLLFHQVKEGFKNFPSKCPLPKVI